MKIKQNIILAFPIIVAVSLVVRKCGKTNVSLAKYFRKWAMMIFFLLLIA